MSSFYAYDFIFDDIPSQKFDIKIMSFEEGGIFNGVGSSNTSIISQRVLRKSRPYYLGRIQEPVLEFSLTFGSPRELTAIDRDIISAWLFGRAGYKKLHILQDDLQNMYFNCFMTDPEPIYIGNIHYAFTCKVVCDSPFAYGTTARIYENESPGNGAIPPGYPDPPPGNDYGTDDVTLFNGSSEDDYLYPQIEIQTSLPVGYQVAPWIRILQLNEPTPPPYGRYTGLSNLEFSDATIRTTYTIDNDLQILWSNNDSSLITKFNKKWMRLVPGNNPIRIFSHEIYYIKISYTERFKVGG